jgi:nitrogen fixation NifU-like protein
LPVFSPAVLDHFKNPRNPGDLPGATAVVEVTNPACGDLCQLAALLENGRVAAARFKTRGCVTSIACASLLTELMLGKTPAELRRITPEQLSQALDGLSPATFHGSQLACDALAALLEKLTA